MGERQRAICASAESAIQRLSAAIAQANEPHADVFDVLGACYRMENLRRQQVGGAGYFAERDADPAGHTLGGIIYVRNLAEHQGTLASPFIDVFPSDMLYPGPHRFPGRTWRWKAFESLSRPDKPETRGRDHLYRQHLEQADILDTITTGWGS